MCTLVDTTRKLNRICEQIFKETNRVAIDTEFLRKNSYFPKICLIQVGFLNKKNEFITVLIDPISKKINLKKNFALLSNPDINKIFCSATQDFDALYFLNKKLRIENFDDIQMMLEFCSLEHSMGYSNIIKMLLDITLEKNKDIQVSNWEKRPLSKKQMKYASEDVKYLFDLYDILLEKLISYDNYNYYEEEIENFKKRKNKNFIIKNAWEKMKIELHKKPVHIVKFIKKINELREKIAIENNVIRSLVLEDSEIEGLLSKVNSKETQTKIKNNKFLNKYEKYILDAINSTRKKNSKSLFYSKENGFIRRKEFNDIYTKVQDFSIKKQISVSRLLTKFDIISILMNYCKKEDILYGWKHDNFCTIFDKTTNIR